MPLNATQQAEVEEVSSDSYQTRRITVPAVEEILFKPIPVLDHGFVRVIDYMGDDSSIVQAARVSYGKGTKKVSEDKGLINYLMRNWHTTPFEMCELKIHAKMPIFVARDWVRHRTANINEYSGRYSVLDREFYIPSPEHLAPQSKKNHQGRGEVPLEGAEADRVFQILKEDSQRNYDHYEEMLNEDKDSNVIDESRLGLARELARINLTLNCYTQWYWKIDLHNLFHFLMLRANPAAQYELRVYADVILDVVSKWVPFAHEAYIDYRENAVNLSGKGTDVVKRLIKGEKVTQENSGMSKREWRELAAELDLEG